MRDSSLSFPILEIVKRMYVIRYFFTEDAPQSLGFNLMTRTRWKVSNSREYARPKARNNREYIITRRALAIESS